MHRFPLAAAGKLTVEPVTLLTVEPVEENPEKGKEDEKGEKPRSNVGEMRGFHSTGKSFGVVSKSVPARYSFKKTYVFFYRISKKQDLPIY